MLPNSSQLICGENCKQIQPYTDLVTLQTVPFRFKRTQNGHFLYCNVKDNMITYLIQASVNKNRITTHKQIEQFMGNYQYACYSDDHLFLLKSQGDITLYNYHSKESYFLQKQHPSNFSPIQIHNIESTFITCGGNVMTSSNNQKIIKLWQQKHDQFVNHSRIVTGHNKHIENSFILSRNKIVTLSTDRTIRCTNLTTQQVDSITAVNADYYSGCPLDWNTALVAGTGKNIDIYDSRTAKIGLSQYVSLPIIQICQMQRLTSSNYILANVNQIWLLDIRNMSINKLGYYQGQRITNFTALSKQNLLIGNRDKTFQVWNFY